MPEGLATRMKRAFEYVAWSSGSSPRGRKQSYRVPIGRSRRPESSGARPRTERRMKNDASPIPSSRGWPAGASLQRMSGRSPWRSKASSRSRVAYTPRRLTQPDRWVVVATSADTVTSAASRPRWRPGAARAAAEGDRRGARPGRGAGGRQDVAKGLLGGGGRPRGELEPLGHRRERRRPVASREADPVRHEPPHVATFGALGRERRPLVVVRHVELAAQRQELLGGEL